MTATKTKKTKATKQIAQQATKEEKPVAQPQQKEAQKTEPLTMPGFAENMKACDVEVANNTIRSFVASESPSKKATHLAALALIAKEFGSRNISLTEMFNFIQSKMDLDLGSKASDVFRTILYNDYYPQTRAGKQVSVKGAVVTRYAYDNSVYCTCPLVEDPNRNPRRLWGFILKPEFVEIASKFDIDLEKLSLAMKNLK